MSHENVAPSQSIHTAIGKSRGCDTRSAVDMPRSIGTMTSAAGTSRRWRQSAIDDHGKLHAQQVNAANSDIEPFVMAIAPPYPNVISKAALAVSMSLA